jgi:hypothetical protein
VQCARTMILSLSVTSTNYIRDRHSNVLRHVSVDVSLRHCSVGDDGDENVRLSNEMLRTFTVAEPKSSRSSASTTLSSQHFHHQLLVLSSLNAAQSQSKSLVMPVSR